MKRLASVCLLLCVAGTAVGQESDDDPGALQLLDRMSQVIGELGSCQVSLAVSQDVADPDAGLIKRFDRHEAYFSGSDRFMLDWRSDQRHAGYWYNGETVTYYSYDENNYAVVAGPATTLEMITAVNRDYGVDFPAADFFYPTFTDDLIESTGHIRMVGKKVIEGEPCFHIVATSPSQSIQLWIADDSFNLPLRAVITDLTSARAPQYEVRFTAWKLNPILPDALFEATPPVSAAEITLVPRTTR